MCKFLLQGGNLAEFVFVPCIDAAVISRHSVKGGGAIIRPPIVIKKTKKKIVDAQKHNW